MADDTKKKKKKKSLIGRIITGIVVVILVLVLIFMIFGESAIRATVQKAATDVLGVRVTLDDVDLKVLRGKIGLDDLIIYNPEGYKHPKFFELTRCRVDADMTSLMGDTIQIPTVILDGVNITIEQKGLTSNLQQILKNIEKNQGPPEQEPQPEEEPAEPAKPAKNVNIQKLRIENVIVRLDTLVPGKMDTVTIKLDPIELTDIGTAEKMNVGDVIAKVMRAIAVGIAKQGGDLLPDGMVEGIGSAMGKTLDIGKDIGTTATEGGKKILEEGSEAGKNVVEGIKGLLGGKKEPTTEE